MRTTHAFGGPVLFDSPHTQSIVGRSLRLALVTVSGLTPLVASNGHAQTVTVTTPAPQVPRTSPLDGYIHDALRANLALAQTQLDEDRAMAGVREARELRLPSISFSSRRTRVDGGLDFGDLVNPAYRALNQLTQTT